MVFFLQGIIVSVCKIVVEEISRHKNAHHISNIEITENAKGKEKSEHFEFFIFYKLFKSQSYQGKPHNAVDPHGIVLLNYAIRRECIEYRKADDGQLIKLFTRFMKIISKGQTATAGLK